MKSPEYRYKFFTSYLYSLQVVIRFTYVLPQIGIFGVFEQNSAYLNDKALLKTTWCCRMDCLELISCHKIFVVHLLFIFMNIKQF